MSGPERRVPLHAHPTSTEEGDPGAHLLSDPFVRRMVGPAVKIGQLRRMRARAEMEVITAGALLFRLDGNRARPELETLVRLGYVPAAMARRRVPPARRPFRGLARVGEPRGVEIGRASCRERV